MLAQRLIERKRNGGRVEPGEWRALVHAYASGHVADHELAAFLMAAYLRGLDLAEARSLTEALLGLGEPLLALLPAMPRVDFHSTGGTGDKASLVVAPIVASLGVPVPMLLGRSMDAWGGTLDKLQAVPGVRTKLSLASAHAQLERVGCVMMECPPEVAPLDARMTALRHATSTVECVPLIAAEIAVRKLGEGLRGLVLDIKVGSGGLLPSPEVAVELASLVADLTRDRGCETVALLTALDRPLGRAVGNALELEEAIHALHGEGPADLVELSSALAAEMLLLAGQTTTLKAARDRVGRAITSGAAARKLGEIIDAQGGNPSVVEDPSVLPQAEECELYLSPRSGFVSRVDPRAVGRGLAALGGGSAVPGGQDLPAVGFVISAKPGDWAELGEPLATVFAHTPQDIVRGRAALAEAIHIGDESEPPLRLVSHRVASGRAAPYVESSPDDVC
jgi:pyrimidine-nucleoside phosphorylase